MSASYPSAVKTFATRVNGTGNYIDASHVNDLQDEVNAIESGLLNGTAPMNSSRITAPALSISAGSTLTTLSVTGASTLATLQAGASTHASLVVSGGSTLASLTVAGGSTLATVNVSGASTFAGVMTLTGGAIIFPATQSASANANALDDYEEGTWTPVIGGASGTSGQTYGSQVGKYVKVGKKVMAQFDVTLTNKGTITGALQIQGLPFTIDTTMVPGGTISFWGGIGTVGGVVFLSIIGVVNTTTAAIYGAAAATADLSATATGDVTNTTRLVGSLEYIATA